jgi:hypothetical protein
MLPFSIPHRFSIRTIKDPHFKNTKISAVFSLGSGNIDEGIAATLSIQMAIAYARNILIPE